ncbi:piggyBac transposable element-derived protein 4-like [Stegodyphus dumicola]|uniref:piggyBac transposable element-derived protein 4-like n=1 Tax=Stegodyphus dumicola TaxID=202533 RepID=UPI0015AB9709|nr:piggyBac transposable element-derived protein 4-like [Stegodyphus dumicola]
MESGSDSEDALLSSDIESCESSESDSDSDSSCGITDVRDWCQINMQDIPPAPPRFPFHGVRESKRMSLLHEFFMSLLQQVNETNRYAGQYLDRIGLTPSSRCQKWTDTNESEIKVFLALLLLQGILRKPKQKWFWTTRPIISTPFISKIMSEKRDISIDESLLPYKGRLSWKQYIPSKRARFGIKMFHLCESASGYIWRSIIYTGKDTSFDSKYNEYGLATKSVLSLLDPLLDRGYCLTVDNFYNSPELADILIRHKTDIYGTLRPSRKNVPAVLKATKVKKGDIIAFQRGKMMALKWTDKKTVCMLSTVHNPAVIEVNKQNKIVKKPLAVIEYNDTMAGVDKADQSLSYYPSARKQQKRHYKKMFLHLLNQLVWNAFVLYSKRTGTMSHLEFRLQVIENLIQINARESNYCPAPSVEKNILRLKGRHFPSSLKQTGKKKDPCKEMCSLQ